MSSPAAARSRGRPAATSHGEIERVAFQLFRERGFSTTTLDDIAAGVGVGKRTLFRYYASKNDIPWGQFADTLTRFEATLAATPHELPIIEAVHRGILSFNDFPPEVHAEHRFRMHLILSTPELQAHSVLQYAAWRQVISRFVATRTGHAESDLLPQIAGHASLALAMSAYEAWLSEDNSDLLSLLDDALSALRDFLGTKE